MVAGPILVYGRGVGPRRPHCRARPPSDKLHVVSMRWDVKQSFALTSGLMCFTGVLLMRIWGTEWGRWAEDGDGELSSYMTDAGDCRLTDCVRNRCHFEGSPYNDD